MAVASTLLERLQTLTACETALAGEARSGLRHKHRGAAARLAAEDAAEAIWRAADLEACGSQLDADLRPQDAEVDPAATVAASIGRGCADLSATRADATVAAALRRANGSGLSSARTGRLPAAGATLTPWAGRAAEGPRIRAGAADANCGSELSSAVRSGTSAADAEAVRLPAPRPADDWWTSPFTQLCGEMGLLQELAACLGETESIPDLLRRTVLQLQPLLGADSCGFWSPTLAAEPLWINFGAPGLTSERLASVLERLPPGQRMRTQRLHVGNDAALQGTAPVQSLLIAPMRRGRAALGWFAAAQMRPGIRFRAADCNLLAAVAALVGLQASNTSLHETQVRQALSFVRSLARIIDAKDHYTRGHSDRVAALGMELASRLQLSPSQQEIIHLAGLLHDIGKVGVDDAILKKPGKLTAAEFDHVKRHPVIGWEILSDLQGFDAILPAVRHHHERYDGGGYPDQLDGPKIPRMARIIAVADAYDAMRDDRPYRPGLTVAAIAEILRSGAGRQWDPAIVEALLADLPAFDRLWATAAAARLDGDTPAVPG